MAITISTESKDILVDSKERAIRMIEATAYSMQLTHDELKAFTELQRLAEYFNIDTYKIKIEANEDSKEKEQGFCNTYAF
jgi:hypothetical protein